MKRKIPLSRWYRASISTPRPELSIEVLTSIGFQKVRFVLDKGSDFTTIPRSVADRLRIPFERATRQMTVRGIGGRAQASMAPIVIRLFGVERSIPCVFAEIPVESRSEREPPSLLGRAGFLTDLCDVFLSDRHFILTHRASLPNWLYRIVSRMVPVFRETDPDDPI